MSSAASVAHEHFARGLAYLEARDHLKEAEEAFRAALALEPEHPGALLRLGVTLRVQGQLKEALTHLEKAIKISSQDPDIGYQTAKVHQLRRRLDKALSSVESALGVCPGHEPSRVLRAIILQDMGRWGEAFEEYTALLAELPLETSVTALLPQRLKEVEVLLGEIAGYGIDRSTSQQLMAKGLYRVANNLVLEGRLDEALNLYALIARLRPDYSDPDFPIGETVAAQLALHPEGEYLSCPWIESCLHFHEDRLAFCCTSHGANKGWATVGEYHGGPVPVDFVLAKRAKLRMENQALEDNACLGCPELESHVWPSPPRPFQILIINSHSVCNQLCDYCFLAIAHFEMPAYYYMAESAINELIAKDWLAPDAYVLWGGGEPTVSQEFPVISRRLFEHGCSFNLYSNVTRVMPLVLEALKQGRCDLVTSVDSGMPKTFYRVKYMSEQAVLIQGRPAFEVVWDNIKTYLDAACDRVYVKYIFKENNIGEEDLKGFIDQCMKVGARNITLVPEFSETYGAGVPAAIWEAIGITTDLAVAHGLRVHFNPLYFDVGNMPEGLRQTLLGPGSRRSWDPHSRSSGPERYLNLLRISTYMPCEDGRS